MSKGGFKNYHFSFTGDGRTTSSVPSGSTLGTYEELCLKIITNAASCLMDAGWEASDWTFYDYPHKGETGYIKRTMQQYSINNHQLYLYHDSSMGIMEVPLVYTKGNDTTKIWLLYYYKINSSSARLDNYLDSNKIYTWYPTTATTGYAVGLSILYLPPHASNPATQCFRLASSQGDYTAGYTSSSYGTSLAMANTNNSTYTYQFLCKNDFIAMTLRNSAWSNNEFTMVCLGEILGDLYDSLDTTYTDRKYCAIQSNCDGTGLAQENGNPSNTFAQSLFNRVTTVSGTSLYIPWEQWYNVSGTIQRTCCNDSGAGAGLFYNLSDVIRSINRGQSGSMAYSKILIGNVPSKLTSSDIDIKVSNNNYIKGTLNEEYMISVDLNYTSTNFPSILAMNQTLDNGNYIHVGSGICVGWDANNAIGLSDNSPNTMVTPTLITP